MLPVQAHVKQLFTQAIKISFPSVPAQDAIVTAAMPKFGDYQCNNAMALFKDYRSRFDLNSAQAFAEEIEKNIPKNDVFESVTVAKSGFITVKISTKWLTSSVADTITKGISYEDRPKKRVCVDFSSPNVAKEMHVGHLRSTIIGDATCRILEFCGHDVHRINHTGDWGTQFGMLIEYMKMEFPDFQKTPPPISDLNAFYKKAKQRFDEDPDFKKRSQLGVVSLQAGEPDARSAWKMICEISRQAFQKIYDRLDVELEERGESHYNDLIAPLVKEIEDRGIIKKVDGAKCIWTPDVQDVYPLIIVKTDGGYGYDSTDLACIYHRLVMHRHDWVIYITDLGQEQHFFMIWDVAKRLGWHRPSVSRLDHMGFGLVLGEDGKKFKTRSGDVVKLVDLLDEACERSLVELKKRREAQEEAEKASDEELEAASRVIGMAAIKYFDLKNSRINNYAFSYDKMLDPRGNTAVYLLYAYARLCSIFRKAGKDGSKEGELDIRKLTLAEPSERDLALSILRFPDTIEQFIAHLQVHFLAEYCYELTNKFTTFYTNCRVVGVPEQESRLILCEATRRILKHAFTMLGFTPLERL